MPSWVSIIVPVLCCIFSAVVTIYVQSRRERARDKEKKKEQEEKEEKHRAEQESQRDRIADLELTQGELADCVAKHMRNNPDSEVFHRIRSNKRVTRVTNIEEAVLYVRKPTKRIPIQDDE